MGGRTVRDSKRIFTLLVLAGRAIITPLFINVLGDQSCWINKSHPSRTIAQTPEIGQTTADRGEAPAVRDHAYKTTNSD